MKRLGRLGFLLAVFGVVGVPLFAQDWDHYRRDSYAGHGYDYNGYGYSDRRDVPSDAHRLRHDYKRMRQERWEMRDDLRDGRIGEYFEDRHDYRRAQRDAERTRHELNRDLYGYPRW